MKLLAKTIRRDIVLALEKKEQNKTPKLNHYMFCNEITREFTKNAVTSMRREWHRINYIFRFVFVLIIGAIVLSCNDNTARVMIELQLNRTRWKKTCGEIVRLYFFLLFTPFPPLFFFSSFKHWTRLTPVVSPPMHNEHDLCFVCSFSFFFFCCVHLHITPNIKN